MTLEQLMALREQLLRQEAQAREQTARWSDTLTRTLGKLELIEVLVAQASAPNLEAAEVAARYAEELNGGTHPTTA